MKSLADFLSELKRRRVFRVAAVYAGVAITTLITPISAQSIVSEVSLRDSELYQFQSENGTEYDIYVGLPPGYESDDGAEYPVVYVLDARARFLMTAQICRPLQFDGFLPPMIFIGIDRPSNTTEEWLAKRAHELTPTSDPDFDQDYSSGLGEDVQTGGADAFLRVITKEIFPWVENRYHTSSERGLIGMSFSGLFSLHTLFISPESFNHYLIVSPTLEWDDEIMFDREELYASEHDDLEANLYLAAGSLEEDGTPQRVLTLTNLLESRGYENLQVEYQLFEGETHSSIPPFAFSRGLRYLYGGSE